MGYLQCLTEMIVELMVYAEYLGSDGKGSNDNINLFTLLFTRSTKHFKDWKYFSVFSNIVYSNNTMFTKMIHRYIQRWMYISSL